MSKLVTNDNLKAYHAELAEHIKLLQRNTAYALNDIVNYDGMTLKCTTAGTTNTTKPNISVLTVGSTYTDGTCVWTRVDLDKRGIDYYESAKDYVVDDQVVYDNKIYKCITAHTSTSTFDDTKWAEISVGGSGGISVWQSNTAYNVNDVVIDSNLIWQCATAHTSTSTFDESKWVCISGGEISNGLEIVPLWEGEFSFTNSTQGATPTSSTPMIQLSESINNFECLMFIFGLSGYDSSSCIVNVSDAVNFTAWARLDIMGATSAYTSGAVATYDSTHLYIKDTTSVGWPAGVITKVQGIRKAKPIVSSGMKYETLWSGDFGSLTNTSLNNTIDLNDSIKKYKKIGFQLIAGDSGEPRYYYREISVDEFMQFIESSESNRYITFTWTVTSANYLEVTSDSTVTQLSVGYKNTKLTKIIGISEGVVVPTGVQAAKVTLWEGFNSTLNSVQTLSDNIKNYDQFEVTYSNNGIGEFQTHLFDVSDINYSSDCSFHCDGFASWGNPPYYFVLSMRFASETTWSLASVQGNGWSYCITKIVGIKYIQPDSYSTEEKLIGTWIDGKPLYKKTLIIEDISLPPSFTTVDTTFINLITGLKDIVNAFLIAKVLDYGNCVTSQTDYNIEADNSISVRQGWGSSTYRFTIYFTIEYTKN